MNYKILRHFLSNLKRYLSTKTDSCKDMYTLQNNVHGVLEVLRLPKYKNCRGVQKLFTKCENEIKQMLNDLGKNFDKKNPFIVIEGLDASGKTTAARYLARSLDKAVMHPTPPACIQEVRHDFNVASLKLRTALYLLANYLVAWEISKKLSLNIIIIDRYWHSTCAFAIARCIKNDPITYSMPPKHDDVYEFPKDLLKPDIIFLLVVSEEERLRRHSGRSVEKLHEVMLKDDRTFRRNVLEALENMRNPSVIKVNADPSKEEVLANLQKGIKHLL